MYHVFVGVKVKPSSFLVKQETKCSTEVYCWETLCHSSYNQEDYIDYAIDLTLGLPKVPKVD